MTKAEDFSHHCRTKGLMDVTEVSEASGVPRRTLYDWWRTRPRAVVLIVMGLSAERSRLPAAAPATGQFEDFSDYCKEHCGLDATEVAETSKVPRRTLYDWWRTRPRAVVLIVEGIATERRNKR